MRYYVTPPDSTKNAERDHLEDFKTCKCEFRKTEEASLPDATPSRPVKYPNGTFHLIWVCDYCGGFVADQGLWSEELYQGLVKKVHKSKNMGEKVKNLPLHLLILILVSALFMAWLIMLTVQSFLP